MTRAHRVAAIMADLLTRQREFTLPYGGFNQYDLQRAHDGALSILLYAEAADVVRQAAPEAPGKDGQG